ncbi:MAG: NAD(P)-dependent oxidoreductase [candidate division NC10 bacterium]|nr:NAD(P)-dependent oxidoreductase [candidate division NC10 bacterium]
MVQTVGFIGLGIMGGRMAKNVLKAGVALRAYNRTAAKAEEVRRLGATVAASPREAAAGADAVITMVADPPALAAVLEGPDGALAGCRPGTLVIDMSTVDPDTSRTMAARAASLGLRYLEAPVTGGVGAAERGTLLIMAGGTREDFAAAKPLLETMGGKILHAGPMGSGSVMKLATNLVASSIYTAMAEGLVFATKAGLDPGLVAEVLAERSPLIASAAPRVLAGQFTAFFPLRLSHKDVHLALATARSLGVPLFGLGTVGQLQTAALAKGLGELDQIATIQVLEEIAGVQVRTPPTAIRSPD